MTRWRLSHWTTSGGIAGCLLLLYLPIGAQLLRSLQGAASPADGGIALHAFAVLLRDPAFGAALASSLKIALLVACGSVLVGTLAAFALDRCRRFRGRALFGVLLNAPLVMPEAVVGLSLATTLAGTAGLGGPAPGGTLAIALGHLVIGVAYAAVVVQARLQALDPRLGEAAADLGARPHEVFTLVTLPIVAPALVVAGVLSFVTSLHNLVLSAFLAGPGTTTLPLQLFNRARSGSDASIAAAASLSVLAVAIAMLAAAWMWAHAERRRAREHDGR